MKRPDVPTSIRDPWYREAFHEDYLDVYPHRDFSEAARAVKFLTRALELSPAHALLDLCCGPGRHLALLRRFVGRALGLDLSGAMLARARDHWHGVAEAQGDPAGPALLVQADMRRLPLASGSLDRVVNLFTSFGYFEREEDNDRVLAEIARLLRPGGRLALDHINRTTLLSSLVPHSARALPDGRRIVEERRFDEAARRVIKRVTIEFPGDSPSSYSHCWRESVRIYEIEELETMLRRAGLEPRSRHGDYDGGPWRPAAPRLILIAAKVADSM